MSEGLFVTSWGRGPDVVFLHGLGASSRYWEALAGASGGYRGIAPDLLGFGRSPSPPTATYDVDCHLAALEPHLPRRAFVVAHSAGAILAAALAARQPERVSGLLLIGLPAYPDESAARDAVGDLGLLARLTAEERPAARVICNAMCRMRPLAMVLAPLVIRDLPPSIASDGARHTWPSYSRTLRRVVIEHRAVDDLLRSLVPTTLVHGAEDRAAPVGFVRQLGDRAHARIPALNLRVAPGDHHLAVRQPELVARALTEALAGPSTA